MNTAPTPLDLVLSPVFGRRQGWRDRFLAIAREVEKASVEAFQPPVSPVRRIPMARPRART